ncbi:MAG: hypothetical protein Q4Q21_02255 [Lachnospiraceae bacterium]|nr:hypothetical protein [Lachnospiraceae bacterium]
MDKNKLGDILVNAGHAAKEHINKSKDAAIRSMDQNADGKFDLNDVAAIAESVGDAAKMGVARVKENADESRKRMDLRALRPIFADTLDQADFLMSKLIRVVDRDKKHAENEVCKGSIGFLSDRGGLQVVNLFKDSLDVFGLSFYPDADCEFYYVNPSDRDNYISLDDYFSYLKMMRINELQRVAQDLGAKHFKVTYKEERTSFSQSKGKAQLKMLKAVNLDGQHDETEKKYSVMDVAAEMQMDGHEPHEPKLVYLLKDENVQNLIHLRMAGGSSFHHHKISIKMSNSSGIKENDAAKIDAVLKGMKVCGNATVVSEVQNESRRYLEYEIDF